jgi:NADH-quinone oxidoreductase subunit A
VYSYIPIVVMICVAGVIAGAMVFGSLFLGPKKPGAIKSEAYECGMRPVGNARQRFPVKFYLIAMLFIVFDVETIFLYPWAVAYAKLPYALKLFNFIEMAVFVAILFVGYFYLIGSGALDWEESELARYKEAPSKEMLAARPAIRFGNEKSGPTDLSNLQRGPRIPAYGASSQEEHQFLTPAGQAPEYSAVPLPAIKGSHS